MPYGVLIGFGNTFHAPVRRTKRADASAFLLLIQFFDDRTDLHRCIITMQEIDVNNISMQSLQAFIEVRLNRSGCETRNPGAAKYVIPIHSRMTAFGYQDQFTPTSRFLNPSA